MDVTPRRQDESHIGKFLKYSSGPLAGRCVRSELHEYQKPDLGRKFAKRDRRPLDPPPAVRLRMYELFDQGLPTEHEEEIPADEIDISGLVAHLDLYPVPSSPNASGSSSSPKLPSATKNGEPSPVKLSNDVPGRQGPGTAPPAEIDPSNPATASLFGSSFVHAVHMDWRGEPVVFFVFSDLSIRLDGYFCLRYRFFDLFGRMEGSDDVPIAAELWSGTFIVYSTKDFPGLQASTSLTKHLSRWGVRVNLREGERKRPIAADSSDEDETSSGPAASSDAGTAAAGAAPPKKRGRPPGR